MAPLWSKMRHIPRTGWLLAALAFSAWGHAFAAGGTIYTYDSMGRMTSAIYDTGVIVKYTYDMNGNRLSQIVNMATTTLIWTATTPSCTSNCWGSSFWKAAP